jgi:hypothetical protein
MLLFNPQYLDLNLLQCRSVGPTPGLERGGEVKYMVPERNRT